MQTSCVNVQKGIHPTRHAHNYTEVMSDSAEVSFNVLSFLKDMFFYFIGNILILKDLNYTLFTLFFSAFVARENSFLLE